MGARRRGLRRFGAIVAWLAAASVFVAAPALADGNDAKLVLRSVDAVKYPNVALTVMPVGAKPASYKVSENGKDVGAVKATTAWIKMVEEVVEDEPLGESVLGESLPPGLRLMA